MTAIIRPAADADHAAMARIYNHYVEHTVITFEETPVSDAVMGDRVVDVARAALPWLVAEADGRVVGYACATPWKTRSAYRFSTETTVYLDPSQIHRGIGSALYRELIATLRRRSDIHAVMGGIALPNAASIALHEKVGMTKVAHFREVGYKFGRWVDVGYWQLILQEA